MKRRIQGLHEASPSPAIANGLFLVGVERARFAVLEPKPLAGRAITGRVCSSPKVLWKLSWFLRDFGCDAELLGREEVDEKALVGLRDAVEISHAVVTGTSLLSLEGFAQASQWEEASAASPRDISRSEVA